MPRHPLPPLIILLVGAFGLLRQKAVPVLLGVLCFAMLFAIGSAYLDRSTDRVLRGLADQTGLTVDEIQSRMETEFNALSGSGSTGGSTTASSGAILGIDAHSLDSLLLRASAEKDSMKAGTQNPVDKNQLFPVYLARMSSAAFGVFVFDAIVLLLCMLFFYMLSISGPRPASDLLLHMPFVIVPLLGLVFMIFIRSLIWVPVLGLPLALYFLPRLSIAPMILLSGEGGVFQSIALSMKRTRGLWFPILLRLLYGLLVFFVIGWFVMLIAGSVMLFSVKFGFICWLCGFVFMIAFAMAYLTVVTATVG